MRRLRGGRVIAGLTLLGTLMCGPEDAGEPAGFRIVRELEPPPGGSFVAPVDLVTSPDRIWVLDAGAARVYGYDGEGGYRLAMGGKGTGPGKLLDPLALGSTGDTLWVLNTGNRRIEYYSTSGRALGSDPLPRSLPPPVDLARFGGEWILSTPFRPGPLLRFDPTRGTVLAFGSELEEKAREIGSRGIPDAYRIAVVDGRLWAMHLYLPVAGIYAEGGRLERLLSFPASGVGALEPVERALGKGRIQRILKAPRAPAGSVGVLDVNEERFLLTQQRSGDRQRIFRWDGAKLSDRPALTPPHTFLLTSATLEGRSYAIGTNGDDEPAVFLLE